VHGANIFKQFSKLTTLVILITLSL